MWDSPITMSQTVNRRKISTVMIDPRAFGRFSIPFILLLLANLLLMIAVNRHAARMIEMMEIVDPGSIAAINQITDDLTRILMVGMGIFTLMLFGLWAFVSHRIFGPSVPIRRHIAKLIEGDYTTRITLRQKDEFKDVAEDLNRLAERLQKSNG